MKKKTLLWLCSGKRNIFFFKIDKTMVLVKNHLSQNSVITVLLGRLSNNKNKNTNFVGPPLELITTFTDHSGEQPGLSVNFMENVFMLSALFLDANSTLEAPKWHIFFLKMGSGENKPFAILCEQPTLNLSKMMS